MQLQSVFVESYSFYFIVFLLLFKFFVIELMLMNYMVDMLAFIFDYVTLYITFKIVLLCCLLVS